MSSRQDGSPLSLEAASGKNQARPDLETAVVAAGGGEPGVDERDSELKGAKATPGAVPAGPGMSDIAIRVTNVGKCYHIYNTPRDRLKQFVLPRVQRLLGRTPGQYFREFWALNDVSFEIKKGETVGIVGRNGSGKSTLLQIICGTLSPTTGTVEANGRVAALLELGSGFNPEFTGRENIYMNAALLGLSKEEVDARFDDVVTFADIGEFIEYPVKTYSSGMFVRLAFAVIAHVDADVLIIDEALAVGDAVFSQKCGRFLRKFREKGTLLFVSHDMQSVLDLCDRAVWLSGGDIHEDGVAKEVVRKYSAYVYQQSRPGLKVEVSSEASCNKQEKKIVGQDQRKVMLKASNLRYQLEVFRFDTEAQYWGAGGAKITDVEIMDTSGKKMAFVDDCGTVVIRVHCIAVVEIGHPVIGINIRNQRGVEIISENSFLTCIDNPPPRISAGERFCADFKFFLPYLSAGEYSLGAAVADGVPGNHIQHHRRDDTLRFKVLNTHVIYGIFATPLEDCKIYQENDVR